jgi:Ca2+-transporting ATPase
MSMSTPALPSLGPRRLPDATLTQGSSSVTPDLAVPPYHFHPPEAALDHLGVADAEQGLPDDDGGEEVGRRRKQLGANMLPEARQRTFTIILMGHLMQPLSAVLLAVFAIGVATSEWVEAVVVMLVLLVNALVGAYQESQSEQALGAIRHLAGARSAFVVRGGRTREIPVGDVVVGDIVELRQGQQVPADLRLLEVQHLEIDESCLTGESHPAKKVVNAIRLGPAPGSSSPAPAPADGIVPNPSPAGQRDAPANVVVGDRVCMAYRQTEVAQGQGRGIAVAVGVSTEIGAIARRLADRRGGPPRTPLARSMDHLFYLLLLTGIIFSIFIFWAFEFDVDSTALLYASATVSEQGAAGQKSQGRNRLSSPHLFAPSPPFAVSSWWPFSPKRPLCSSP